MFFSKIVAVFAVAVATASVGARPLPLPLQKAALTTRGEQVVRNMEEVVGAVTIIEKRQTDVNKFSAGMPTQANNNFVGLSGDNVGVPEKRQTPVQDADGTNIVPFNNAVEARAVPARARDDPEGIINCIDDPDGVINCSDGPDPIPDGSLVNPVQKRQPKINTFPTWVAARSDGGEIVAF